MKCISNWKRAFIMLFLISTSPFANAQENKSHLDGFIGKTQLDEGQAVFESAFDVLEKNLISTQTDNLLRQQENYLKSITYEELSKLGNPELVPLSNIVQPYINYQAMAGAYRRAFNGSEYIALSDCDFTLYNLPKDKRLSLDLLNDNQLEFDIDTPDCLQSLKKIAASTPINTLVKYEVLSSSDSGIIQLSTANGVYSVDREINLVERTTGLGYSFDQNLMPLTLSCDSKSGCETSILELINSADNVDIHFIVEGYFQATSRTSSISIGGRKQTNFVNGDFSNFVNGWDGVLRFGAISSCVSAAFPTITSVQSPALFVTNAVTGALVPSGQLLGNLAPQSTGDGFADYAELSQTINVPSNIEQLQYFINFAGGIGGITPTFPAGTSSFRLFAADLTMGTSETLDFISNFDPNSADFSIADVITTRNHIVSNLAGHMVNFTFSMCDGRDNTFFEPYIKGVTFIDDVALLAQTVPPDAFEENDSPAQFTAYSAQPQTHNFADDIVDWIGVYFPNAGTFDFATSALGANTDTCINIFLPNATFTNTVGSPIASNCDGGSGQASLATLTVPADSAYFIRVTNSNGLTGANTDYTFSINAQVVPPDAFEENDSPAQFTAYNAQPQAHNFADDIVDWIGVYFPNAGTFDFTTSALGTNTDTCINIFLPNATFTNTVGSPIASNCDGGSGQASLATLTVPADSAYFIRVTNSNGLTGASTHYTFSINAQAVPSDAFEENDSPAQFTAYSAQPQAHNFADDIVDWIGVYFPNAGTFDFVTSALGANTDTCINIFLPNATFTNTVGSPIASNCDGGSGQASLATLTVPADSAYFIRVTNSNGLVGADTHYTFSIN